MQIWTDPNEPSLLSCLVRHGVGQLQLEAPSGTAVCPLSLPPEVDERDWRRGIQLDFIRPGKSVENGQIESFNGRVREESLSVTEFAPLEHARATLTGV